MRHTSSPGHACRAPSRGGPWPVLDAGPWCVSFAPGLGEGRLAIRGRVPSRCQSVFEPLTGIVQELIDRVDIAVHAAGYLLDRHATQRGRQGHPLLVG